MSVEDPEALPRPKSVNLGKLLPVDVQASMLHAALSRCGLFKWSQELDAGGPSKVRCDFQVPPGTRIRMHDEGQGRPWILEFEIPAKDPKPFRRRRK